MNLNEIFIVKSHLKRGSDTGNNVLTRAPEASG